MERDKDAQLYDDKCFSDINPMAGTDLAAIKASIDEYWKSAEPQMIMASSEEECEKLYQQAIDQIKSMGFDQLYEFQNEKFHKISKNWALILHGRRCSRRKGEAFECERSIWLDSGVFNQKRQTMVSGDGRVPLQQIPGSLLGGIAV